MSEIFNKAVGLAKEKLSPQEDVLDALYGKTEEAYEKFEKLPIAKQILASMAPGIGNVIAAKEVDVFGGRAKEAFEEAKYGQAAGYGGLTALAALGTLPGVGLIGRGARTAMRSGAKLLDDPMEKAIKEVGEKAKIPETARGDWKYPDETTGIKSLDEPVKITENIPIVPKKNEGRDIKEVLGITSKDIIDWKDLHKGSGYKEIGKEGLNELQESVQKKLANKIDIEEHISNVENLKPITRWDTVPEIPTFKDIAFSLRAQAGKLFKDSKYDKVGRGTILYKNKSIEDGIITTSRLDIPAYQDFDKWVVTLGPKGSNNVYAKTGYFKGGQGGRVQFNPRTHLATQVGIGKKPKNPFGEIEGGWSNHNPEELQKHAKKLLDDPDWIQVGYDPRRHGVFYTREAKGTIPKLSVVEDAEEVIQIGPLVLAKNPTTRKFKVDEYKQGGQIATGLAGLGENIVYRAEGDQVGSERDQVGMSGMGFDQLLSDDPAVQAANYSVHSTQQPEREDQSDDGWYEDVIIDYDNNEIYADPIERTPKNPEHIDEDNLVSLATKVGFYDRDTMPRNVLYHLLFKTPAGRAALNNNMVNREGGYISKKGEKGEEHLVDVYYLKEGYNNDDLDIIQSAANNGDLQKIGIEFANTMEYANKLTEKQGYEGEDLNNLNTFGKNMRSSMEAWSTGDALSRDGYDPGILVGTAKYTDVASERKKALTAEAFTGMLDNARRGETVGEIYQQYFQRYGTNAPVKSFGYNENSNAQARDVAGAINAARGKGMFQGIGMMMGFGMTTLPSILTAGWKTDSDGYSYNNDAFKQLKNIATTEISKRLPDEFTKTSDESGVKAYVKSMSPLDKQPDSEKTGLDQFGDLVGTGAQILDALRNPLDAAAQYGLKKAGESFGLKSIRSFSSDEDAAAAREKSLSEDPTWRDRIRDFLPDFGPTPLPSDDVSGGENVTEAIQFPSIETASLPVAPEEQKEQRDFGGAMLAALTAPKPPQQNRNKQFIDYLYSTNNIFT